MYSRLHTFSDYENLLSTIGIGIKNSEEFVDIISKTQSKLQDGSMFYLPEDNVPLGMWHVEGRYVDMDLTPHINDHVTLSGINNVDHFTKKGFFTINNSVMTATGGGTGEFDVRKYHKIQHTNTIPTQKQQATMQFKIRI